MHNVLRISFSLRNTYRVNGILYSLKQIPLLKRLLPETLYRVQGLKTFANILSLLWEIVSVFLGKFLYFAVMLAGDRQAVRGGAARRPLSSHPVFPDGDRRFF